MKLLSFLFGYSRKFIIIAIIAGIVSGAANAGLLAAINAVLRTGGDPVRGVIIGFAALAIALAVSRATSELLLLRLGQGALFDLRMDLSRQILAVPLRDLEEIGDHKLLFALTDDIPTITNVINIIPVICINIAVVIACMIYMGWLSLTVLLLMMGLFVLGIITYQFGAAKALSYFTLAREEGNLLVKHFQALTNGVKELKLHHTRREMFLNKVLSPTASSFRNRNVRGMTIYTIATSWGQLLVFVTIGLLLFVVSGLNSVDSTILVGFTLTFLYIMTPLQVIMNSLPVLGRGEVALKNVENLGLTLSSRATERSELPNQGPKQLQSGIELGGITHSYRREGEESSFVLGPIDLTLRPGELIFLIGGNGSGKTTLAKLITGLYSPESGSIYVDGEAVTDESRESYRQYFSVVFSDFYLFDSLLGLEAPQLDARARDYLVQLQLAHKVEVKDGVLSTTELSQGQRKRLALLTAYLEDRPVCVFDEWTADQDVAFKEIFYLRILPELKAKGKTVLVITHDERYHKVADHIIKLDGGRIINTVQYLSAV
jgi:putative pyoverdin transport system ATP-binding/permease protein